MIAPMIATPIVPPTWRALFSTAEPTPALSTGTLRVAAAALGVMVSDIPTPPMMSAGRSSKKDASAPEAREDDELDREEDHPAVMSPLDPSRSLVFPASGAMRMISTVIGQEGGARLHGRVAEDVLHVQGHEEEHAEHRERDEQDDEVRARVGAVAEELEREHRRLGDGARAR